MTKDIIVLIILLVSFSSCQKISNEDLVTFSQIPQEFYIRENLIKGIKPNHSFDYWEYRRTDLFLKEVKVIASSGEMKSTSIKNTFSSEGFFAECMPGICVSYIVVEQKEKIEKIITEAQLRQFIGHIDNLQEALLVLRSYGYWFDSKKKEAGAYKFNKDCIELIGIKEVSTCPVRRDRIYVKMDYSGQIETQSLGIHYQSSDCYLF